MRFEAPHAIALAVAAAISTTAEDDHNHLGHRHRRLSAATSSGEISTSMSVPLPDHIDIWEGNESYDYNVNEDEEGDDVIANIIGGALLQRGERPYLVSLGNEVNNKYTHVCGGTLITSRTVLSAAHCFTDMFGEFTLLATTIKINIFELDNNVDVISYPICSQENGVDCDRNTYAYAMRHPLFDKNETVFIDNDFTLIFLPANVKNIKPVALNTDANFPSDGIELEISGWGDTENRTGVLDLPNVPYKANVMFMPSDLCTNFYNLGGIVISTNQLCTSNEGKATGGGDSGGPLVHIFPNRSSVQVGVTSFGIDKRGSGFRDGPSVFSRISAGLEWISTIVCGEIGEWCDKNEDFNTCFNTARATSYPDHLVSDFDVDRLPGFIEERIESGAYPVPKNAQRAVQSSFVMPSLKKNTNNLFEGDFGVHEGTIRAAKATNSSLPYIVSLGLTYLETKTQIGHVCAGTLIQPDAILTSAHCFTDRYGHKIRLNWVDLTTNTTVSRIQLKKSNIWRHIKYNHTTRENDIALVFLDNKVDIQPVRLNDKPGFPLISGSSLNVTGWGPKNLDGLYPNRQQTVTELYEANAKCNYPGLTPDKMCTTSISDDINDRCIGDSGSPVIVNIIQGPLQVGVTSLNSCRARPAISPPCPGNTKLLTVSVLTDMFPGETSWTLTSVCSGQLEASVDKRTTYASRKKLYSDHYCIPDTQYVFTIFDEYEDGICCGSGNGGYNVTFDGRLVASGGNFAASDRTQFGNSNGVCPLLLPNIHSRVSAGMEWINQAIQCRSGTKPHITITPKPGTPTKTGKVRKKSSKAKKSP